MTPSATERAPFKEHRCPDTGSVVDGKTLNIKNSAGHNVVICQRSLVIWEKGRHWSFVVGTWFSVLASCLLLLVNQQKVCWRQNADRLLNLYLIFSIPLHRLVSGYELDVHRIREGPSIFRLQSVLRDSLSH